MPEFKKDPNELGVLWEKESARGPYMTGMIGDQPVVVFRNTNKRSNKAPDWRILKSQPRDDRSNTARRDAREEPRRDAQVDSYDDVGF